jgi:hypothetical protein
MNVRVRVTEQVIISDRQPTEAEQAAGVVYDPAARLAHPEMINTEIQDRAMREAIPSGMGKISVSIQPGARLGQLVINVQFEGRRGHYDFCVNEHNRLLLEVGDLVQEILGELGGYFDVKLCSLPCPQASQPVTLDLAAGIIEQRLTLVDALAQLQVAPSLDAGQVIFVKPDVTIQV